MTAVVKPLHQVNEPPSPCAFQRGLFFLFSNSSTAPPASAVAGLKARPFRFYGIQELGISEPWVCGLEHSGCGARSPPNLYYLLIYWPLPARKRTQDLVVMSARLYHRGTFFSGRGSGGPPGIQPLRS